MTDWSTNEAPDEAGEIHDLLARADVWVDEPGPEVEDRVVAAIAALAGSESGSESGRSVDGDREVARRRELPRWWLGAAAVAILVVAGIALAVAPGDDGGDGTAHAEIELAGTELAPGASAAATVDSLPDGLAIRLTPIGLEPAESGSYYEAWITDGTTRFSAGGFHMRGGTGPIVLWAGVDDPAFRTLTVTLEPADGDTQSSGAVVLRGDFSTIDD